MRASYVKFVLVCGTALSGGAWSSSAIAQAVAPTTDPVALPSAQSTETSTGAEFASPTSAGSDNVGEIVVTARKRAEFQRDVPISVQTVSGAQLTAAKITQIIDLQSRVPALTISTGLTQPFVGIRGFGSGNSQSFDQAVGKFIDNVSYGRDQDARLPLFDLERVEVLKGPQVLLFGNSTTAGALNITTKKPGSTFAADASAAYEFNNNEIVVQGGVTAPLTDNISLRVSGIYQDLDRGPNFNVATGKHIATDNNYAGRAILRIAATPELEILLKAEYDHVRNRGGVGEPIAQPIAGPFQFTEVELDGRTNSNNKVAPLFQKDFIAVNNETYQMDMNYEVLGGTITSTTAFRRLEVALSAAGATQIPLFNGYIYYDNDQFSQEFRYSGKFDTVDLTFGAFYQHEDRLSITTADFNFAAAGIPLPTLALDFQAPLKTNSYSIFGDVTYHFTPALSLALGARYTDVGKRGAQVAGAGNTVPGKSFGDGRDIIDPNPMFDQLYNILFGVPVHNFQNLRLRENHFQPQVIGQYRFTDKDQVYAKFVKGAKSGGFDVVYQGVPGNVSPDGATFEAEKAESFEVGVKGLTLDNKLNYALAAYRTTFTNLQTNAYVGQATVAVVANVGKARTQGFEAEFQYAPVPGLRISGTGTYNDAKYLDFPGGTCTRAQLIALPVGCVQDLSGTPTPFSSKWAGTLGVDYEQPVSNFILGGGVLVVARSKFNVSTNNEPLLVQKGFAHIDAHIDLKPQDESWSLSLFGRNLTDKRVLEYGSVAPGTNAGLLGFLSRGRQIGIRAGFNF